MAREHAGGYDLGPAECPDERPDEQPDERPDLREVDLQAADTEVAGVGEWVGPGVVSRARSEGVHATRPAWLVDRGALRDELATDPDAGPDAPDAPDASGGSGLRDRVRRLEREARRLLSVTSDPATGGGELGALVDLAGVADLVQATMVGLAARVETGMLAQNRAGLPLPEVLGLSTRLTHAERRGLLRTVAGLERMPALAAAVQGGLVGAGEARTVLSTCRRLKPDARTMIDDLFADQARLATQTVDDVLDEVAGQVALIDERRADDDRVKAFERRFLSIQPGLDGTCSGYFEFDDGSGAILLAALDDAAPPITGDRALTRDATLPADQVPMDRRTLGRRRLDGLVEIAHHWLASHSGSTDERSEGDRDADDDREASARATTVAKRARPLVYVWTDISTLVGTSGSAAAARMLWDTLGPNPVLTPAALRRLADDARLQFILVEDGEVLGVAAPVATIPAKVRAAVHARDHGCRFPGCAVPIHQTDLHHVIGRAQGGHTTVANLVAICRRHHQAITEARWRLDMDPAGRVTVRRGRHTASTDPPTKRRL